MDEDNEMIAVEEDAGMVAGAEDVEMGDNEEF